MGNAATREDLTWQLDQMYEQGIGGVEQITMQEVYEKGNVPYLSDGFLGLVTHAIAGARDRGMELSLNFGGPGWVVGGDWVAPEDRSQNLLPTAIDLRGDQHFAGALPTRVGDVPQTGEIRASDITDDDRLVAAVAARVKGDRLEASSLVDLTAEVGDGRLEWDVPEGVWRLMCFWLHYTGQGSAVDHFSKAAMERYCHYLGGRLREAFGEDFGATVDSLFCDSFEVALVDNAIYWSDGLLERFEALVGYDLTRYLPAIWWDLGEITPRIRYDVNDFLHRVGLDAFFGTFLDWCEANGVNGRIQPYGFTTDILQGAGLTHVPEMEITAGEKDAVPCFDTRIGPKKYVASGAHLYARNVVSVEAYTYIHWESYRATLEELKIASDVFLKYGANKFYNHGYTCSPERDIAPSRRFESEVLISHSNVWGRYYRLLGDYVARCCYLLRRGHFVADVAVYSPLANQWTLDVRNPRHWTRDFDWGGLGKLLIANGYDLDLINDDVLQHSASLEEGALRIGDNEYRILILPNIESMPLESLERIRDFARLGGVVIALERVPELSVGLAEYERRDAAVRQIVAAMFDRPTWRANPTAPRDFGEGRTYHIHRVIDRSDVLEWHSSAMDPFLNALRRHVTPDVGIDFVGEGMRENGGLTYIHRRSPDRDIYFVTNLQDRPVDMPVAFRVSGRAPSEWNPHSGRSQAVCEFEEYEGVTRVPLRLPAYGSSILVFEGAPARERHVTESSFEKVLSVSERGVSAQARRNGMHRLTLSDGRRVRIAVEGIPQAHVVDGLWELVLESPDFPRFETTLPRLASWTADPRTRHFSGTGRYRMTFELPGDYIADDLRLDLDLGVVGDVADVELNGQPVGVRWMRGQQLEVTRALAAGRNTLVVDVTNTLINRVAGLEELPPVPEHLESRYGGDLRRDRSPSQRLLGYEPLPVSGLLGPVEIRVSRRVNVSLEH